MNRRRFLTQTVGVLAGLGLGVAAAAAQRPATPRCHKPSPGYGRCLERGCDCERFSGRGNICNCGHNFYRHY